MSIQKEKVSGVHAVGTVQSTSIWLSDRKQQMRNPFCRRRGGVPSREQSFKATGIISLREQKLTALPKEALNAASNARVLDVAFNRLVASSVQLASFTSLTRLVLSDNKLKELPPSIAKLEKLKVLFLDRNALYSLDDSIFASLTSLEHLDVSLNPYLTHLLNGSTLVKLTRLKELHASGCQLTALPNDGADFSPLAHSLELLDASENRIQAIPESFSKLHWLHKLNLDGNNVGSVPPAVFKECKSLAVLSLKRNPKITRQRLEQMEGYHAFVERMKAAKDKHVWTGALIDERTLDEGFDPELRSR